MKKVVNIRRNLKIGKLIITYTRRSKKLFLGRFGGGWNWQLGFEAGGCTIIFMFLICSLRFDWYKS